MMVQLRRRPNERHQADCGGDTMTAMTGTLEGDRSGEPWRLPLESLDPSDGMLWHRGVLLDYLQRLREEDPVHWSPTGPTGGFWSLTRFDDIVAVDSNHKAFSSDRDI